MSDLQDFTQKNRRHTGTTGIQVSDNGSGPGDRVNEKGRLRFNDTTDLLEYYNGNDWKSIDAPPSITGFTINDVGGTAITSGTIDNEASGTSTIEVLGSLFDTTNGAVTFVGGAETLSPASTTRNSANKFTLTVTNSEFDITNSPYTIKLTNGSGLSAELAASISADQTTPTFTNAADTTVTLFDASRGAGIAAADLCGASNASSFAVTTGSLPSGLSMTSSTGAITGTADAVGSDTTSTFTVTATGDDATATRQFKITIKAPVTSSITSTGAGNFAVPTGVSALNILMVAGGGSGGSSLGSGGGAGGMLEGTLTVTPGSTIAYNVGAGGAQTTASDYHSGYYGANTTFGPIPGPGATATAVGGGYGCGHASGGPKGSGSPSNQNQNQANIGGQGGSSGGTGSADQGSANVAASTTIQGDSAGLTGYGNYGGTGGGNNPTHAHSGGGGGGAGGAGGNPSSGNAGNGGVGRVSNITGSPVYYAGGGGGSYYQPSPVGGTVGSAGNGGGSAGATSGSRSSNGGANTGGGTGCGGHPAGGGGTGGSGIIVLKY
tara:strand:+ start:280 stop:1929 length:1650 start_codon:yes stop_codon:yes gene_type:complete